MINWLPEERKRLNLSLILFFSGVVIFIAGTILQLWPARYPELSMLMDKCEAAPETCSAAVRAFDMEAHRSSAFTYPTLFGDLLRSIGAAIVISILITMTVESRSRRDFDKLLSAKIRELGLSVFYGMFNRDHPTALLNAVKQQILERDLIRDHVDVTYSLSLIKGDEKESGEAEEFIKVDVILASSTTNVSTLQGDAGKATMPLALGLPNPQVPALKTKVTVSSFIVNGEAKPTAEISAVNEKLQEALENDDNTDAPVDFGEQSLEAGETSTLSATYTMIKELEDTEVFRTSQICRALSLTVIDRTGLDLHIQAKGIHPGALNTISAHSCTLQWRIDDIILPSQGIMVFWKRRRSSVPGSCGPAQGNLEA